MFKYHCSVDKARGRAVFENNGKAFGGCEDQTVSLNTRGVVYFACLSGRSYVSPGQRSAMKRLQAPAVKENGAQEDWSKNVSRTTLMISDREASSFKGTK